MNYEKYLPIGTVVKLKDAEKRIMITGFLCVDQKDESKIYDYCGCLSPEGIISADKTLLFNHDQIAQIFHIGFIDQEEKEFKEKLKEVIELKNKI